MIGYHSVKNFILLTTALSALTPSVFAINATHRHVLIQLGGHWSNQGKKIQHIDINGLIGDDFTVSRSKGSNGLVGIGYLVDGYEKNLFQLAYGINAFYLAQTPIKGTVIQEGFFNNLSYSYNVTNYPVLAIAKSTLNTNHPYSFTLDLGIGPNFIRTNHFREHSLDNGVTLPEDVFSGHTTARFSAMTGLGVKLNNVFGSVPLECGYKFFYLGKGSFNKTNDQLINTLRTGTRYANTVMCSISV